MLKSFWQNRQLIYSLASRDILARYRGSFFGILWSLLNPLLLLAVYTFIFSEVFKSRWPSTSSTGSKTEFALVLFSGLIIFTFFSECISRAPSNVLGNVAYVKKIVFPLEILTWVTICSAFFNLLVSLLVLLVVSVVALGQIHWTVLLLPVVLVPLVLITAGLSWFISSLGVFFRDIGQTVGLVIMAMMFMSPLFYPASAFPAQYVGYLYFNPMTLLIEEARALLIWGTLPDWTALGIYTAVAITIAFLGHAWFARTKSGFADVL